MALTNPGHFENDVIHNLRIGFNKHVKYHPANFNHKVVAQYMKLFDKIINKDFIKEYRNPSLLAIKVKIDQYANNNNIPLKEL